MPDIKEVNEARRAANDVLRLLSEVEKNLKSARNWGFYDMVGGGFFSSLIKHSKVDKADRLMSDVRSSLYRLQKELKDVNLSLPSSVGVSDFERFMDIAFDNIISDWFTQSRINDSLHEVSRLRRDVERILNRLDNM